MKTIQMLIVYISLTIIYTLSSNVYSQEYDHAPEYDEMYNTFSANIGLGSLLFFGDIKQYDFFPTQHERNIGVNISLNKQLDPYWTIQAHLLSGKLSGENRRIGTYFTSSIFEYSVRGTLNLTNLFLKKLEKKRLNIYAIGGIGLIQFHSEKRSMYSNTFLGSAPQEGPNIANHTTELVIPRGLGVGYKLNDYVDFYFETILSKTNSDKIDVETEINPNNDNYSYTCIGVSYRFGYYNKSLDWIAPKEVEYSNNVFLQETHSKIDTLSNRLNKLNTKLNTKGLGIPIELDKSDSTLSKYISSIYYGVNQYELTLKNQESLTESVKLLGNSPSLSIKIVSYADRSKEHPTKTVCHQRSITIKSMLSEWYGIDAKRIIIENIIIHGNNNENNPEYRKSDIYIF